MIGRTTSLGGLNSVIENQLHSIKDETIRVDRSHIKRDHGPMIRAILRDTVISLLHLAGITTIAARLRFRSYRLDLLLAFLGRPSSTHEPVRPGRP